MFAITSGQSPFIIQYLHRARVRLGLRGPPWEGGLLSPLQHPHLLAGSPCLRGLLMHVGLQLPWEPSETSGRPLACGSERGARLLSLSHSKTCNGSHGLPRQGWPPSWYLRPYLSDTSFYSSQHLYSVSAACFLSRPSTGLVVPSPRLCSCCCRSPKPLSPFLLPLHIRVMPYGSNSRSSIRPLLVPLYLDSLEQGLSNLSMIRILETEGLLPHGPLGTTPLQVWC